MHVMIINASPRVQKFSNTDKIIDAFVNGLKKEGATVERYTISDRKSWDDIEKAYEDNEEIIIAMPLYVECVPGLFLEFLDTLPVKNKNTRLSFILQGGFAEAGQYRCGEEFLRNLPEYLGCSYGSCLVKGDNFSIRFSEGKDRDNIVKPYEKMGTVFARELSFDNEESREFSGPEFFPLSQRLIVGFAFKTFARKIFRKVAEKWGCKESLMARPYAENK